ncbi:mixed lineage kinase domain-like protein [Brachionichthys hirsutus]|uniref:mixed lineage kinase domain-like protein n=1 Tax=Brachionichthys hirsutus TaxID=412623 RepID=UPI0036048C54
MDVIDPILFIASEIYTLVEKVKANKNRCLRVSQRVRALDDLVRSIKQRALGQTSADVERALKELCITLKSAQVFIAKFTLANWLERVLKSSNHGDKFSSINERLNDAFQVLSGSMQVQQGNMLYQVFELHSREREDEVDRKDDDTELKNLLLEHLKNHEEKAQAMLTEFEALKINVGKIVENMNKPSISDEVIRMIKPVELKYEYPKVAFMTTSTSEVYRGQYHGFQVAIKRYIDPMNTTAREVRSVFDKEVHTMKHFESPNILRMFGICIHDEDGSSPQFLIIMEYCEKGSLRQVLDSSCTLSWTRKACMCLDAAKGLYRLHNTEKKSKVHGCISSSKFLVAKGYTVKLGGFELAKTETSLKKAGENKGIRSLCYAPPQMLNCINHVYNKECEMYSFGIVLWEIATRKKPFEGWSNHDIYQKVCKEKFQEPLPDDCPKPLAHLINSCRAYESFQRPSAGVLMDKLGSVVAQLEGE